MPKHKAADRPSAVPPASSPTNEQSSGWIGKSLKNWQSPVSGVSDALSFRMRYVSEAADGALGALGYRDAAARAAVRAESRTWSRGLPLIGSAFSVVSETAYRSDRYQKAGYNSTVALGLGVTDGIFVTVVANVSAARFAAAAAETGPGVVPAAVTGGFVGGGLASAGLDLLDNVMLGVR